MGKNHLKSQVITEYLILECLRFSKLLQLNAPSTILGNSLGYMLSLMAPMILENNDGILSEEKIPFNEIFQPGMLEKIQGTLAETLEKNSELELESELNHRLWLTAEHIVTSRIEHISQVIMDLKKEELEDARKNSKQTHLRLVADNTLEKPQ